MADTQIKFCDSQNVNNYYTEMVLKKAKMATCVMIIFGGTLLLI